MRRQTKWVAFLFLLLTGCPVIELQKVDPCANLEPGQALVLNVRPNDTGFLGHKGYTAPWIAQHSMLVRRDQNTTLVCTEVKGAKCVQAKLEQLCVIQSETPASSDLLNKLSSPVSFLADHTALVP